MNNINKKINLLFLTLLLIVISIIVIVINGKTYTIKYDNIKGIKNIEELKIEIEDEDII